MDVHLVLKQDPSEGESPNFVRFGENKIGFSKFQTQFEFKTVSLQDDDIFIKVASPLIENKFLKDQDVLLLTLGPTNSGKSHILYNKDDSLVDQSLKAIFDNTETYSGDIELIQNFYPDIVDCRLVDGAPNSLNFFSISMFELYNDNVIDLLNKSPMKQKGCCDIITDSVDHKLSPKNISKILVNSYASAHQLIYEGYRKRKTCPTFANSVSSRSHCFIFLNIHKLHSNSLKTTRFTIVDLAGLERSKSSRTSGQTLREASHTNGSLTELGRCLELISMNQFHRTCLRTNKLTRLVLNDFVKNQNRVSIITTLDPFGETGLILQTLRYIDPIKHQILQRRSLIANKTRHTLSPTTPNLLMTAEIEKLRKSQKDLKQKINILESCIVETENRVRTDMYNENEKNIAKLIIKHREEIDKLNELHLSQTDQKLQDQSLSFNETLSELKAELKLKSDALQSSEMQLQKIELELQQMTHRYDSLCSSMIEKQDLKQSEYMKLEKRLEDVAIQNEALKIEINTLQLNIDDAESSHEKSIQNLKEEHSQSIKCLQLELNQSNSNNQELEKTITSITKMIEEKDRALKEVTELYEKSKASLAQFEESSKHTLEHKRDEFELTKEKLEGELERSLQQLVDARKEHDNTITQANLDLDMLKNQLKRKEIEFEKSSETFTSKLESLSLELRKAQDEKLRLESEISTLSIKMETASNELKSLVASKNDEINLLRTTAQQMTVDTENSISLLKTENEKLQRRFEDATKKLEKLQQELAVKENQITLLQGELKNHHSNQSINDVNTQKALELEQRLKHEIETNTLLSEKVKAFEQSAELKLKEQNQKDLWLQNSKVELESLLKNKEKMTQELLDTKSEANQNLAEIQRLKTSMDEETSKLQKMTTKYSSLKSKSAEIAKKLVSVEQENLKLKDELSSKDKKLFDAEDEINELSSTLEALKKNNSKPLNSNSAVVTKTPQSENRLRKSLSILDTDPMDDVGLPLMLSSPIKPPSFHIHSDIAEKENTITLPVVDKKKKNSSKKLSKKDKLYQSTEMHEKKLMESLTTPKVEKKKFKALTNSKLSDLNKLNIQAEIANGDKLLKRRKSSSPLKSGKKKLRKSLGPSDSMELLN
ncbi:hypothetical protein CANINC_000289 [Pichia inconspicua]|uniref:Kinesin motor domain-containing protein n=1 Tax=Pichia inconspicua TaxID=52247 RepID=A0A4T0X7S9_9ASCO|nr:hypothetical protein CANINC_000289 [[Candida] inconspicua]